MKQKDCESHWSPNNLIKDSALLLLWCLTSCHCFCRNDGYQVGGQWRVTNKKRSTLWAPCFWTGDSVVRWHCLWGHDDYFLCNHDFSGHSLMRPQCFIVKMSSPSFHPVSPLLQTHVLCVLLVLLHSKHTIFANKEKKNTDACEEYLNLELNNEQFS